MTASTLRRVGISLLATVSLVLAFIYTPSAFAAPRPIKVVVLGDSFSSGNGAGFYEGPEGCYRSPAGWVNQYADGLRVAGYQVTLVNRACSGAETRDIANERVMGTATHSISLLGDRRSDEAAARQTLTGLGLCVTRYPDEERYDITSTATFNGLTTTFTFTCTRILAPQIQAVDMAVDLVLMTIGGNDIHFGSLVRNCFVLPDAGGCRASVQTANRLLGTVQARVTGVLTAVGRKLNSSARLGLVSYPYLEMDDNFTLWSLHPPDTYRAGEEIRKLGRSGDEVQTAAVNAANRALGRSFADFAGGVKERFAGHEPDGRVLLQNLQGWLHEVASPIPAEWYHLNPMGHREYAGLMLEAPRFGPGGL
jgi:lysophospholipase L1-like esterase